MKAKAMCIKRICIAFFDAADDSAANSYYPKKLFQAVRGNNGNADEGATAKAILLLRTTMPTEPSKFPKTFMSRNTKADNIRLTACQALTR